MARKWRSPTNPAPRRRMTAPLRKAAGGAARPPREPNRSVSPSPPSALPAPPVYTKVNPAAAPILPLGVTSKTMPLPQVQNLVDTRLAQKISQLPGVGLVTLSGGQRPAVRIQVNPRALAANGLNLEDVRTAVAAANVNQAKGSFDGPSRAYTIDAHDQLRSAPQS